MRLSASPRARHGRGPATPSTLPARVASLAAGGHGHHHHGHGHGHDHNHDHNLPLRHHSALRRIRAALHAAAGRMRPSARAATETTACKY